MVWFSRILNDTDQFVSGEYDLGDSSLSLLEVSNALARHDPIEPQDAPSAFRMPQGSKIKASRRDAFLTVGRLVLVSPKLRDVLIDFDMGKNQFFEVPVHHASRLNYPNHFILNVIEKKNSFLPEHSIGYRAGITISFEGDDSVQTFDGKYDSDVPVLSPKATEGVDMWCEAAIWNRIFFSERLKNAVEVEDLGRTSFRFAQSKSQ